METGSNGQMAKGGSRVRSRGEAMKLWGIFLSFADKRGRASVIRRAMERLRVVIRERRVRGCERGWTGGAGGDRGWRDRG